MGVGDAYGHPTHRVGQNLDTTAGLEVLPYCDSDDQLIDELSVLVTTGFGLPSQEGRARSIGLLLLFARGRRVERYGATAHRLLQLIEDALQRVADNPDAVVGGITEDEATGLRILLGLHPDYRTKTPDDRRAAASYYLVPAWGFLAPEDPAEVLEKRHRPPKERAKAFQKRHQRRSLRLALECLRIVYGQEERPTGLTADTVHEDRLYVVGARRQIVYERCEVVLRPRIDNFNVYDTSEQGQVGNGGISFFRALGTDSAGPPGISIGPQPHEPKHRRILLHLRRPYARGEDVPVMWEEWRYNLASSSVINWSSFFVTSSHSNDGFELWMRVRFEAELPATVWWYSEFPDADHRLIEPIADNRLLPDSTGGVSHHWLPRETERRINYGIKWEWPA